MDSDSWIRAAACGDLVDGEALAVPAPDGRDRLKVGQRYEGEERTHHALSSQEALKRM